MAFVNYNSKEITVKIVYYGPALSGKTTCLKHIYTSKKFEKKGKLITLDTDGDRTLFFDFLPVEVGKLGDYSIKMQLYTVPGQVAYDTTRKLVLQGADGVVFVADSQVVMREQNIESFNNLKTNLELNSISYADVPIVLHYNKRDLREILPMDDLNRDLNPEGRPSFSTIATNGENIEEGLTEIMRLVIAYLKNRLSIFQKDKTVMFSREDVISQSMGKTVTKPPQAEDLFTEDTEQENIMELSSPIEEPLGREAVNAPTADEDDIFDLQDDMIRPEENVEEEDEDDVFAPGEDAIIPEPDDDIPMVGFQDDLPAPEPKRSDPPAPREVAKKVSVSPTQGNVQNVTVPLNIEFPVGQDEIRLNLTLQIVVKKK